MKKALLMSLILTLTLGYASAQKKAQIKFDKMTYDFGTFSESTPVQKSAAAARCRSIRRNP